MLLEVDDEIHVEVEPDDLVAVDFEASGLHATSYPVEVGWCGLDLEARSYHLRPADDWGVEDWSFEAEVIHGMTRSSLVRNGMPVEEATARFEAATAGKVLVSDNPSFEERWGARLFLAAGRDRVPAFVGLESVMLWAMRNDPEMRGNPHLPTAYAQAVRDGYPHVHRADVDALSLAATVKALVDPSFRAPFREGALRHLTERKAGLLDMLR